MAEPLLGLARGGVLTGPGSLERAEWTRSSRLAILLRRERRCMIEEDWGRPGLLVVVRREGRLLEREGREGGAVRDMAGIEGPRVWD
jgi:hypothetical protein